MYRFCDKSNPNVRVAVLCGLNAIYQDYCFLGVEQHGWGPAEYAAMLEHSACINRLYDNLMSPPGHRCRNTGDVLIVQIASNRCRLIGDLVRNIPHGCDAR